MSSSRVRPLRQHGRNLRMENAPSAITRRVSPLSRFLWWLRISAPSSTCPARLSHAGRSLHHQTANNLTVLLPSSFASSWDPRTDKINLHSCRCALRSSVSDLAVPGMSKVRFADLYIISSQPPTPPFLDDSNRTPRAAVNAKSQVEAFAFFRVTFTGLCPNSS